MVVFDQWFHADKGYQYEYYGKSSMELLQKLLQ